jgi:hypothetical protein
MINFSQIRGFAGGQRYSFEELVCQLARRQPAASGAVFRRIEGAGGDGGVEAYWLMTDGTKVGYQAKFFKRTSEIDWAQIDESVEQARKTHPTITKYVIALPCNLTDRRGTKGKGKTGWDLWEDHAAAWKRKWLLGAGRQVEFVPWTAFDLNDQLTALSGQGLLRYWFGATEFSPSWFEDNVRLAVASLDERYHPEDHVDVSVEGLFQFVVRHPAALKKLRDRLAEVRKAHSPDPRLHVERIGKKYQWIALDELLCRLADNYWLGPRYGDSAKKYDNPLDVGFERDIDPTIIPLTDASDNAQGDRPKWVLGPDIILDATPEEQLAAWPFKADPVQRLGSLIQQHDDKGNTWTTLYERRSKREKYDESERRSHGLRQQEFRFVLCVVVARSDRSQLVKFLSEAATLDVMQWGPTELTDGPFLREAPWRDTWPQEQWRRDTWKAPKGMPIAFPVCQYLWESHLDATLLNGGLALIPSPWLADYLSLSPDEKDASVYKTPSGEIAFIGSMLGEEGSSSLVKTSLLDAVLEAEKLECVWLFVGERNVWPGGENDHAAWRRSEGLCWLEGNKPVLVTWKRDDANGRSRTVLEQV